MLDDLADPPGRRQRGVRGGGGLHGGGDAAEDRFPRFLGAGGPRVAAEVPDRGEQRAEEGLVVLVLDAELAVVPA